MMKLCKDMPRSLFAILRERFNKMSIKFDKILCIKKKKSFRVSVWFTFIYVHYWYFTNVDAHHCASKFTDETRRSAPSRNCVARRPKFCGVQSPCDCPTSKYTRGTLAVHSRYARDSRVSAYLWYLNGTKSKGLTKNCPRMYNISSGISTHSRLAW